MPKIKEPVIVPDATFPNKEDKEVNLKDILTEADYWAHKKGDAFIISHVGVEKLAAVAGIKPQINTRFTLEVQPTYANSMNNQVVAEMACRAMGDSIICPHGSERIFYSTGEASNQNTSRGRGYLRTMAEKRAYDRGVLRHLNLTEKVNVYAEDESDDFSTDISIPLDELIVKHGKLLNQILNTTTIEELKVIGQAINDKVYGDLDEVEKNFIREKWGRQRNELEKVID